MRNGYDGWGLYRDPADRRLIVPKRSPGFGWTINLGHRWGPATLIAVLALLLVGITGPILLRAATGQP